MIRLQWLDVRAMLRERKTWLAAAMLLYAVVSIPVLFERPPPHVREAVAAWFGDTDPFALFMYIWIDLVMNKAIAFLPPIIASGVVLRERDLGVLAVLGAKPLSLARYWLLRAGSACLVMALLYIACQLLGALWFSLRIPGFRVGTFLAAMSLHLFAALFATALSAAISIWIGRRGPAALASLGVLSMLVGVALIGYYQPAWRPYAVFNPLALGALSLGHLDALDLATLVPPMLTLASLTALALAIGAVGARRLEVNA